MQLLDNDVSNEEYASIVNKVISSGFVKCYSTAPKCLRTYTNF